MTVGCPLLAHRSSTGAERSYGTRLSPFSATADSWPASERSHSCPSAKTARMRNDSCPGRTGSMACTSHAANNVMPTITDIEASAVADLAHSVNIDSPGFILRPAAEALRVSDLKVRKLVAKGVAFSTEKVLLLLLW